MMSELRVSTRQQILAILYTVRQATIDEIAAEMQMRSGKTVSSVTIRYHLNVLLSEGRVTEPRSVRRTTRGRPQHIFAAVHATGRGNSSEILGLVLAALERELPDVSAKLMEQVVLSLCEAAELSFATPLDERLSAVMDFLNSRGYDASVESVDRGFILYTRNCPYHDVPERSVSLCGLDKRLIEAFVGQSIHRLMRLADGDNSCAYFIEENT